MRDAETSCRYRTARAVPLQIQPESRWHWALVCGELFGKFERDVIDHLSKFGRLGIAEEAEVGPVEGFAVADGAFGGDFDDEGIGEGADEDFKSAVLVAGGSASEVEVIAADAGAPAFFVDDGLEVESGEVIAESAEAAFDVFGEFIAESGVAIAELFF